MFFFVVLYILECITAFSTFRAGIVLDDLKLINSVFNKWVLVVFFFPKHQETFKGSLAKPSLALNLDKTEKSVCIVL